MPYTTKNVDIKVLLDNNYTIKGEINIFGHSRFSDFIENDKSTHIKLTNVTFDGTGYDFLLLNKNRIIGYL